MQKEIEIYVDGSVVYNDHVFIGAGWAFVIPELDIRMSGKLYGNHHNNVGMELQAILEALKFIADAPVNKYVIYCDCEANVKCFKGLGARKAYKDQWNIIHDLVHKIYTRGAKVSIEFLDREITKKSPERFKVAQEVDRLAYVQANSLEIF